MRAANMAPRPRLMSEAPLSLRLVGCFEARNATGDVRLRSRPARALLGVLALSPERTVSRGALAALLWGDRAEPWARQNLRQALHRLRDVVGEVTVDGDLLRLPASHVQTDEESLRREVADARTPDRLLSAAFSTDRLM